VHDVTDTKRPLTPYERDARLAGRLRIAGALVLAIGIVSAGLVYWIKTRSAHATLEDLMPGSAAERNRQIAILIGNFGLYLLQGWEYLQRPDAQAFVIVGGAALVALVCFRVAGLLARSPRAR
jgi:hypothetical protein